MSSVSALDKLKADLEAKRKLREQAKGSAVLAPSAEGAGGGASTEERKAGPPVPARHAPPPPARSAPPPPSPHSSTTTTTTSVTSPPTPISTYAPSPTSVAPTTPTAPTADPTNEEFTQMMEDLGFPVTQRQQMLMLPPSHKHTLIAQWKKKKEEQAKGSLRASVTIPAGQGATLPKTLPSAGAAPPSAGGIVEDFNSLANKKAQLDKLREDLARKKTSVRVSSRYGLSPEDPVAEVIAQTVEKRKQEKLDALNQLKQKLAEKRKNIQTQVVAEGEREGEEGAGGTKTVNEEAVQKLLASLEEKRQQRKDERQKKRMQRRASRAASIRIMSAITAGSADGAPSTLGLGGVPSEAENLKNAKLAALQNAIKSADESKKSRAALTKESQEARAKRRAELISGLPADLVPLTPEEKKIQRESRRIKRESKKLDMVQKEFAIDNQLSTFLLTLTKLEEEFKAQAKQRIEKQMEYELMQKENQRMEKKIAAVEANLEEAKEKMGKLSSTIDRCVSRNPSDIDLKQSQLDLNEIRKALGMEEVFNVEQDQREREAEKAAAEAAAEKAMEESESAPVSGLLAAIRGGGANLKKVSNMPPPPPMAPVAKSGDILTSLQDTLRDALNVRKVAIMDSDSESESESDDDDWLDEELEEYEDLLDMMNTPVNV